MSAFVFWVLCWSGLIWGSLVFESGVRGGWGIGCEQEEKVNGRKKVKGRGKKPAKVE